MNAHRLRSPTFLAPTVAALALALAACGGDDDTAEPTDTAAATATTAPDAAPGTDAAEGPVITIAGGGFGDPLTVAAGTTVTVVNESVEAHTLTADDGSFDTGVLDPGASATLTFDEPGTYAFSCSIHSSMQGSITVTA